MCMAWQLPQSVCVLCTAAWRSTALDLSDAYSAPFAPVFGCKGGKTCNCILLVVTMHCGLSIIFRMYCVRDGQLQDALLQIC